MLPDFERVRAQIPEYVEFRLKVYKDELAKLGKPPYEITSTDRKHAREASKTRSLAKFPTLSTIITERGRKVLMNMTVDTVADKVAQEAIQAFAAAVYKLNGDLGIRRAIKHRKTQDEARTPGEVSTVDTVSVVDNKTARKGRKVIGTHGLLRSKQFVVERLNAFFERWTEMPYLSNVQLALLMGDGGIHPTTIASALEDAHIVRNGNGNLAQHKPEPPKKSERHLAAEVAFGRELTNEEFLIFDQLANPQKYGEKIGK